MMINAALMGSLTTQYESIKQGDPEVPVEEEEEDLSLLGNIVLDTEVEDLVNDLRLDEDTFPLPLPTLSHN